MSSDRVFDLNHVWQRVSHRQFVEQLDEAQSGALLRLLMIASHADDEITPEERAALGKAVASLPEFQGGSWADFATPEGAEALERLGERFREDPDALFAEIATSLGDEANRRHAFRVTVQFLQSDGFVAAEADFVRQLGRRLGIEDEIVDFAIDDATESD